MTTYCVDSSAWRNAGNADVARRWRRALEADQVGICDQVRLEILSFTESVVDYLGLADELGSLRSIPMDSRTFTRAQAVQSQLAERGGIHHRETKIANLFVAAAAEEFGAVVLHYDEDFDRIAQVTGQPTEWIAPPGSL